MRTVGYTNFKVRNLEHMGNISLKLLGEHGNKTHHSVVKKPH